MAEQLAARKFTRNRAASLGAGGSALPIGGFILVTHPAAMRLTRHARMTTIKPERKNQNSLQSITRRDAWGGRPWDGRRRRN
jgi:hypothetical protein